MTVQCSICHATNSNNTLQGEIHTASSGKFKLTCPDGHEWSSQATLGKCRKCDKQNISVESIPCGGTWQPVKEDSHNKKKKRR